MSEINGYKVLTGTGLRAWPDQPGAKPSEVMPYGGPPSGSVKMFQEGEREAMDRAVRFRGEADPNGKDAHEPGSKLDQGKCAAGVLHDFALALQAVANVGDFGLKKYTRGGWQSVPNGAERYFDAMWRHLIKSRHEELDPDSGLPHLDHALWNLNAFVELRERAKAGA